MNGPEKNVCGRNQKPHLQEEGKILLEGFLQESNYFFDEFHIKSQK